MIDLGGSFFIRKLLAALAAIETLDPWNAETVMANKLDGFS